MSFNEMGSDHTEIAARPLPGFSV